jgi:hypothetical protein
LYFRLRGGVVARNVRFWCSALRGLCQLQAEKLLVQSREHISNVLERVYQHITRIGLASLQRSLMCSPEAANGPYSMLNHQSMDRTTKLPLLHVVDKLALFLESRGCESGMARVWFSKWVARYLEEY